MSEQDNPKDDHGDLARVTSGQATRMLIVEDELIVAADVRAKLERLGYEVLAVAGSGAAALEMAAEGRPDLALVDIGLPGQMDGIEAAARMREQLDIPIVYLTAHSDEDTLARAKVAAPFGYLLKPFDIRELHSTIEMALYRHEQDRRVRESEARYRDLYENAPNAYFTLDAQGVVQRCNRRAGELLGCPPEEIEGHSIFDFYADTPSGRVKARRLFGAFLAGEVVRDEELEMERTDGCRIWISLTRNPIYDAEGRIVGSRSVAMDISDRKKAQAQLIERVAQLELLNEIGGQITATLHVDSVLSQAVRLVQQRFDYDHVAVFTLDRKREELVMRARSGAFADLYPAEHRLALGQGVVGRAGQSGELQLANDVEADSHYVNLYPDRIPSRSELSVPIRVAGRLMGVLDVQSPEIDAFDTNDVLVIETVAAQIAVALENARWYASARRELVERRQAEAAQRRAMNELEKHRVELAARLAGARAILEHRDFAQAARTIFDITKYLLGATAGFVTLQSTNGNQEELVLLDPSGLSGVMDPAMLVPIRGLLAQVYHSKELAICNDFAGSEWAAFLPDEHPELDNVLLAPLVLEGETVGLLGLINKTKGFVKEDARMAASFADLASIALHNSRALTSLEKSETRFRSVVQTASDAIITANSQGRIVFCNRGAETMFGYAADELSGMSLDSIVPERFRQDHHQGMDRLLTTGKPKIAGQTVELIGLKKEGAEFPLELSLASWMVGGQTFFTAILRDITERKRAERALQELNVTLEDRVQERTFELQVLYDLSQEIGYTLNYGELFRLLLQHLSRICEYDIAAALLSRETHWHIFFQTVRPTKDRMMDEIEEQLVQTFERLGSEERPDETRIVLQTYEAPDYDASRPALRSLASHIQVPIFAGGEAVGLVYVGGDETHEFDDDDMRILYTLAGQAADSIQRLRVLLAEEQQRLERLVANLPEGILLLDGEHRLSLANPVGLEILSALDGAGIGDTLTHLGSQPLETVLHEGRRAVPLTIQTSNPASRVFEVSVHSMPTTPAESQGTIMVLRDVTEVRRADRQMQQQERLAAVGQLAGGIAHDFNNILTTIILYSQVALRHKEELPSQVAQGLETILKSGRGAADLVRQILDFSRSSPIEAHRVDLRTYVPGVLDVLERTLPENIFISLDKGSHECVVQADPTRIQQVLMNLAVNARDAMPDGGELRVSLSRLRVAPDEEPPQVDMAAGDWVRLSVADTGTGMSSEVVAHIFEPFFTTKPKGKGTGLGLAQVYGIVKQHEGHIDVETKVGQGTTFHVYLPASGASEAEDVPIEEQAGLADLPRGQAETILLVEDEAVLREMGREILESLGYRVLTAADGEAALEVFSSAGGIDLLITDMVMPQMGGKALIEELRKQDAKLKAVAMTGYALAEDLEELRMAGIAAMIQKPFDERTLARIVRKTLGEG